MRWVPAASPGYELVSVLVEAGPFEVAGEYNPLMLLKHVESLACSLRTSLLATDAQAHC